MKKLFKKKNKIIFEFTDAEEGFFMDVKCEGDIVDDYILGMQEFINKSIKEANKLEKESRQNGKNKRK